MIDPLTAATIVSGGIGLADKIFRKKKRPDMRGLENALAILRKRTENEVGDTLGRLRAGGIDPRSGLAAETAGAARSRAALDASQAEAIFANQKLPEEQDESTADLISSLVLNLGTAKFGQGKGAAAQQPISLLDPRKVRMKQNLGDYGRYAPSRFGAYA